MNYYNNNLFRTRQTVIEMLNDRLFNTEFVTEYTEKEFMKLFNHFYVNNKEYLQTLPLDIIITKEQNFLLKKKLEKMEKTPRSPDYTPRTPGSYSEYSRTPRSYREYSRTPRTPRSPDYTPRTPRSPEYRPISPDYSPTYNNSESPNYAQFTGQPNIDSNEIIDSEDNEYKEYMMNKARDEILGSSTKGGSKKTEKKEDLQSTKQNSVDNDFYSTMMKEQETIMKKHVDKQKDLASKLQKEQSQINDSNEQQTESPIDFSEDKKEGQTESVDIEEKQDSQIENDSEEVSIHKQEFVNTPSNLIETPPDSTIRDESSKLKMSKLYTPKYSEDSLPKKDVITAIIENDQSIYVKYIESEKHLNAKLFRYLSNLDYTNIILIICDKNSWKISENGFGQIKPSLRKLETDQIQIYHYKELVINITKHKYVPQHILLKKDDFLDDIYNDFHLKSSNNLLGMLTTDPIARYYNAKSGRIFKIIRINKYSGEIEVYRKVIDANLYNVENDVEN